MDSIDKQSPYPSLLSSFCPLEIEICETFFSLRHVFIWHVPLYWWYLAQCDTRTVCSMLYWWILRMFRSSLRVKHASKLFHTNSIEKILDLRKASMLPWQQGHPIYSMRKSIRAVAYAYWILHCTVRWRCTGTWRFPSFFLVRLVSSRFVLSRLLRTTERSG